MFVGDLTLFLSAAFSISFFHEDSTAEKRTKVFCPFHLGALSTWLHPCCPVVLCGVGCWESKPDSQKCCADLLCSPFRDSETQMVLPVLSIAQSNYHVPGVKMVKSYRKLWQRKSWLQQTDKFSILHHKWIARYFLSSKWCQQLKFSLK